MDELCFIIFSMP